MILKLKNSKGFTMNLSKTNEQAFEALIEKALVGSTCEERDAANLTKVDAQSPLLSSIVGEFLRTLIRILLSTCVVFGLFWKRLKAIFSLLGLIYNDNLHIENKSKVDCRETLHSGLENDTIREMIRSVVTGKVKVL